MQDLQQHLEPFLADGRLAGCIVGAYSEMAGSEADVPFMQVPAFVLERRRVEDDPGRHAHLHDLAGALAAGIAPTSMSAQASDLAVIGYTSGTTGKPKGAMLSHRAFSLVVAQRSLWLSANAGCSDLVILPITHVAGMGAMNQSLCEGRTMVLLARWDAPAVPVLIERRRIDRWAAVTPMLVELLERPELGRHDLSSLKRLYACGRGSPPSLGARSTPSSRCSAGRASPIPSPCSWPPARPWPTSITSPHVARLASASTRRARRGIAGADEQSSNQQKHEEKA